MTLYRSAHMSTRSGNHSAILSILFLSISCAHNQNAGLIITGSTLDAAGITFEATLAGMESASSANVLTRGQVIGWNDFLARWQKAYPDACKAWRKADAAQDESGLAEASAALAELLTQLNDWAAVLTKTRAP